MNWREEDRLTERDGSNTCSPSTCRPGILDERMHLYLAEQLEPGPTALEPGEDIQTFLCTLDEAMRMIGSGEIHDSKNVGRLVALCESESGLVIRA